MRPAPCIPAMLSMASVFDTDVDISTDDGGWHVDCLDAAHTSFVSMTIPASAFGEDYEPMGDFALDTRGIRSLFSKADSISLEDGWFVLKGKGWTRRVRTIPYERTRQLPAREFEAGALFDVELIRPILNEFSAKDMPAVAFILKEDGLRTEIADQKNSMTGFIPADDLVDMKVPEGGAVANYALDYWQDFVKAVPKSTLVELSYQTDYPASVEFESDGLECRWTIAPRIETGGE